MERLVIEECGGYIGPEHPFSTRLWPWWSQLGVHHLPQLSVTWWYNPRPSVGSSGCLISAVRNTRPYVPFNTLYSDLLKRPHKQPMQYEFSQFHDIQWIQRGPIYCNNTRNLNLTRLIYIEITWSGKEGASEKGRCMCHTVCVTVEAAGGRSKPHVSLSGSALFNHTAVSLP